MGSNDKDGVSDEKENKRKDRRDRDGGDAHRPPMHPDAKLRKQMRRGAENGKQSYYNAKNSQASIYKPSDAENIDRADASCTKFINEPDMDSEQSNDNNNFDHVVNLQNIQLHETASTTPNNHGNYGPKKSIDLDKLMNEIDTLKVAINDMKGKDHRRGSGDTRPTSDEKSKSRSNSSGGGGGGGANKSADSSSRKRRKNKDLKKNDHHHPHQSAAGLENNHHQPGAGERRTVTFEGPGSSKGSPRSGTTATKNNRHDEFGPMLAPARGVVNTESNNSVHDNQVIHLYPQPPPGRAAKICVTAR